ncbi:GntR family transcriptional regulator [Caballeronia sp. LjRoot31]|jgi:DNA-binding GntR family transcriptional regulator|uniref:GntR family transcriptional regulator n=1 Tax=Caballeronia sp. LjRoot31 TaxID=3342324 RepID=UPI003ECDF036
MTDTTELEPAIPSSARLSSLDAGSSTSPSANEGSASAGWSLTPETAVRDRRALVLMSVRNADDRPPLARKIFDDVVLDIVEGRLAPGDGVNSVELARRFGTSRTPVREALAELERQGIVVVPQRRRPYIAPVTLKQVKDIYDLRACLFSLVSELIVDTCPTERLAELWKWQAALEDDVARGLTDNYFWHNVGFRLIEAQLAGNEELLRSIGALGVRTLQFRHFSLAQPGRLQRSVQDHRRLLVAYEERDKVTAVSMTRALIMAGFRTIERSGFLNASRSLPADGATD